MTDQKQKKKRGDDQTTEYDARPPAEYWDPNVCPLCGNNEFEWYKVSGASMVKPRSLFSKKTLEARQCTRCGNVQFFAERS